ncbi:MAG: NAD(P)H-binding protein [Nitrososphaeraceae archaeon]
MTTKNDHNIILVTGAAGNVGTELVKQLSTAGAIFRAGVHSNKSADKIGKISSRAELIDIDYDKPETLRRACEGVGRIFLLTPDSPRAVELASNLVKEAKKAGVRHIVKQSNILVTEMEAATNYARLHREAEKIIEESGIQFIFLRPNDFMQNFVNFYTPTIKTNSAFYIPGGDAKVSFVDVRNIAAVAAKVLTEHDESESRHFGKAYNITGPEALLIIRQLKYYRTQLARKLIM